MKSGAWQGHWKTFLIRLFVGAFLPALTTYVALYFLLSLRMTSSSASWSALFIAVVIWNFCNYLMGHTIQHNQQLEPDNLDTTPWSKCYDPYDSFNAGFSPLHINSHYDTKNEFTKW